MKILVAALIVAIPAGAISKPSPRHMRCVTVSDLSCKDASCTKDKVPARTVRLAFDSSGVTLIGDLGSERLTIDRDTSISGKLTMFERTTGGTLSVWTFYPSGLLVNFKTYDSHKRAYTYLSTWRCRPAAL